jgi:hypothetical protein
MEKFIENDHLVIRIPLSEISVEAIAGSETIKIANGTILKKPVDLKGFRHSSREFIRELQKEFGFLHINRRDRKLRDLAFKHRINDLSQQLKEFEKRGAISVKWTGEGTTKRIETFVVTF